MFYSQNRLYAAMNRQLTEMTDQEKDQVTELYKSLIGTEEVIIPSIKEIQVMAKIIDWLRERGFDV